MLTCRALNRDCPKFLLEKTVELNDNRHVRTFLRFMRPHGRRRWQHLKSLTMCCSNLNSTLAEALANDLPRASRLETLKLEDAERTLSAHHNLPLAFAALRSVKYVEIKEGYQHTCRMLEAMRWPLESAILCDDDIRHSTEWQDADKFDRLHPAALFKNARLTLQKLKYECWRECNECLPTYPVYPNLRSLVVKAGWVPRSAQWAITYPHLESLVVHSMDNYIMEDGPEALEGYAELRQENLEDHLRCSWARLEKFSGTVFDLYLLGIPCPIKHVAIQTCEDSLRFVRPVVAGARPERLSLTFSGKKPVTIGQEALALVLKELSLLQIHTLDLCSGFILALDNNVRFMEVFLVSGIPCCNIIY